MRAVHVLAAVLLLTSDALAAGAPPLDRERARTAVEKSLPLLDSSAATWLERADCTSCHHQALGTMTQGLAREMGYRIDEKVIQDQLDAMFVGNARIREALLQGQGVIDGPISVSFEMAAFAAASFPQSDWTDAMFHYVAGKQTIDGGWLSESHRPPLEDSEFTASALSTRAISVYSPPGRERETAARRAKAREWFLAAKPDDMEDRSMRLLGLSWAGAPAPETWEIARELTALQREDGGWAQIDSAPSSDAYATGQALVALNQAAGVPASNDAFRRGVAYLLDTQKADGSWHVPTRRKTGGQRYFETGYPHKVDQFISYAGAAWATMALILAADPRQEYAPVATAAAIAGRRLKPREPHEKDPDDPVEDRDGDGLTALARAVVAGSADDVKRLLEAGADPNAASIQGVTPLHCAVFDAEKTKLLLAAGADPSLRTELGYTASILAGGYGGAFDVMVRHFEIEKDEDAMNEGSALFLAAIGGDVKKVRWLYEMGADPDVGLAQGQSALAAAANLGLASMVACLHDLGADVEAAGGGRRRGTPIVSAARFGFTETVKVLSSRGADVNAQDGSGRTALHWAALIDPGHTRVVEALLSAGAEPLAKSNEGETPLDVARTHGHDHIAAKLRAASGSASGR